MGSNMASTCISKLTRGRRTLSLCTNEVRWWIELSDEYDDVYRHSFRAGSRDGIEHVWSSAVEEFAENNLHPVDDVNGVWWLVSYALE